MCVWPALLLVAAGLLPGPSLSLMLEGSSSSYAQFSKWFIAANSSLELELRTRQSDGLLLYMDDGGYYDFLELKLVSGSIRLRYNLGSGPQSLSLGAALDRGRWHRVGVTILGSRVTLAVDNLRQAAHSPGTDSALGNFTINSFVYLGGLPPWYSSKLSSLALPSVVFEPRFRGEVRNIIYSDTPAGSLRQQDMMAFKGVRQTRLDFCHRHNPCRNKGVCISADRGAVCECRNIEWEGEFCQTAKEPATVSLSGDGYLGYDLGQIGGSGQPIVAEREELHIEFRTRQADGLLFYTGSGSDQVLLHLTAGELRLGLELGQGRLRTGVSKVLFNDSEWHQVDITRHAERVTLSVDEQHKERWTSPGAFTLLSSAQVYVGGAPAAGRARPGREGTPRLYALDPLPPGYVGCLRRVTFTADSISLPVLELAGEGSPLIIKHGRVEEGCRAQPSRLDTTSYQQDTTMENLYQSGASGSVSFTRQEAVLELAGPEGQETGSVSLRLRTTEPRGVLLYSSGQGGHFFGVELYSGHLYLHLALGTGHVKIRVSHRRIDDGQWHTFHMERTKQWGKVTLDGAASDFTVPGEASVLRLSGSLFLGGLPPVEGPHPPQMWSATLELGLVGCVRDLVLDGRTVGLAKLAMAQDRGSVVPGCPPSTPSCPAPPPCGPGDCKPGWGRHTCSCGATDRTGPACARPAPALLLPGLASLPLPYTRQADIEVDEILVRWRTLEPSGTLLILEDEHAGEGGDRLDVALLDGELLVGVTLGRRRSTVRAGAGLDDNQWHTAEVVREGRLVTVRLDSVAGRTESIHGTASVLRRTRILLGGEGEESRGELPDFSGSVQHVVVNGEDLLERERLARLARGGGWGVGGGGRFTRPSVAASQAVSFQSHAAYIGLPQLKAYHHLRLYFELRTLEPAGLVMFNGGQEKDFLAVELVRGHLHLVISIGGETVELKDNHPGPLADNKWHSVQVERADGELRLLVDSSLARVPAPGPGPLRLDGILFLGGVRKGMFSQLPRGIISSHGYQGCLASLELAGAAVSPLEDALVPSGSVLPGCAGSLSSCLPSTCANQGSCARGPDRGQELCDCDTTSFTGPKCEDESTALEWGGKTGLGKYHLPPDRNPDTQVDTLAFGIITPQEKAVVLRVDSSTSNDYMEMEIVDGNVVVVYNLGQRDIIIQDQSVRVNDGKYHVVRFIRRGVNASLQLDDNKAVNIAPLGQMSVFNSQARIQVGGKWNDLLGRVEKPFRGVIAGLVLNRLRPLDLVRDRKAGTEMMGDVRVLRAVPYDYRNRNLDLFERMQQTQTSDAPEPGINDDIIVRLGPKCDSPRSAVSAECFRYSGSGDELISPVYIAPTLPPYSEPKWPEGPGCYSDDEDCQEGSGEAPTLPPPAYSSPPPPYRRPEEEEERFDPDDYPDYPGTLGPPEPAPTYHTIPQVPRSPSGKSYENYDPKYNIYENPEDYEEEGGERPQRVNPSSTAASSTLLIMGIILVVILAIILVIVIVIKIRAKDSAILKTVQESKSFSAETEALAPSSGFTQTRSLKPATTTGSSGGSKPVKEWYV